MYYFHMANLPSHLSVHLSPEAGSLTCLLILPSVLLLIKQTSLNTYYVVGTNMFGNKYIHKHIHTYQGLCHQSTHKSDASDK